ncbi:hypothetical protein [uncultured Tateyamaria sp.]|uniref:hypothetical protein n=1 Tax=uncultured Tateyamaria sp. TaxID=455651 RepID=UPI002606B7E2|nr:hypothetical protein [uncultured Tateyamaria sp.]
MKHILLIITLAAISGVAACGGGSQNVTQSNFKPLGIGSYSPDHSGGTSARSSFDLLSLG